MGNKTIIYSILNYNIQFLFIEHFRICSINRIHNRFLASEPFFKFFWEKLTFFEKNFKGNFSKQPLNSQNKPQKKKKKEGKKNKKQENEFCRKKKERTEKKAKQNKKKREKFQIKH